MGDRIMRLLKSISVNNDGTIIVEDAENGERREFNSMHDAIEFLGKTTKEQNEKRISR